MTIYFQEALGPDGVVDPTLVLYFDGTTLWLVVENGRFWDLYQQWISDGNKVLPIAQQT